MVPSVESSSCSTLLVSCTFANSFVCMRLLQKAHRVKDNHYHQVCSRDCCFMADQEETRSNTSGLSSKDDDDDNDKNSNNKEMTGDHHEMRKEGWLRLSIGQEEVIKPDIDHLQQHQTDSTDHRKDSFLELNLLCGGSRREEEEVDLPLSSLFHNQNQSREMMINPMMLIPTRSTGQEMISTWTAPAFRTPFVPKNLTQSSTSSMMTLMVAGPSSNFRVIDAPRRPHSGIWFLLQASQNQTIEPFLPQIPKSYLRIKDGKMTVRLLMKYLVNKLRLDHESQVEIRCRGKELEAVLTLQHVRDVIWRGRRIIDNNSSSSSSSQQNNITLLPNSSTSNHLIMVLQYGRTLS